MEIYRIYVVKNKINSKPYFGKTINKAGGIFSIHNNWMASIRWKNKIYSSEIYSNKKDAEDALKRLK